MPTKIRITRFCGLRTFLDSLSAGTGKTPPRRSFEFALFCPALHKQCSSGGYYRKRRQGRGRNAALQLRTDLALEAVADRPLSEEDITLRSEEKDGVRLTYLHVRSAYGARELQKPQGRYVTMELPPLSDQDSRLETYARRLGRELQAMLPPEGTVLVAGLGNSAITPDALGPQTARLVLATRHIEGEFARSTGLSDLRPTAVFATGVRGNTGVESAEAVRGLCSEVHPAAVIAVDALAAKSMARLGRTVQLSDSGIAPGSGVGNTRRALNRETLGVPVIAVGVPTVVDAATLVADLVGFEEAGQLNGCTMMVTPREIDLIVRRASRLIAMAVHSALQPAYSPLELMTIAE